MFRISDLLLETEYAGSIAAARTEVTGLASDTRKMKEGCAFVCLSGTRHDTHADLETIEKKGAALIIAQRDIRGGTSLPVLLVKDTRQALSLLWSRACGEPQTRLHMTAVTGTNGKTSTTFMIQAAMLAAGFRVGLIGTTGCLLDGLPFHPICEAEGDTRLMTMTTPDPDLLYPTLREMEQNGITHVVMEVSSHALEMKRVAPILFDLALFTNLSSEHMDLHHSMENYLQTKARLFRQTKVGIFNIDDSHAARLMQACTGRKVTCSCMSDADYTASDIRSLGVRGNEYVFNATETRCLMHLQIPGRFSVNNSLLACAAATEAGVCTKDLRRGMESLKGVAGRMQRITDDDCDFSVIIDYAHTEVAMRQILRTVRSFLKENERLVLIFGCGGDRDKTKRAAMGKCAEELADHTIVTSDNPRSEDPLLIIKDILGGFSRKDRRTVIVNRKKAILHALRTARKGDVILLVGKGHEQYEIIGDTTIPFSEAEIVRAEIMRQKTAHTNGENA